MNLIAILDIGPYIRNAYLADATTWQIATDEKVDIFLTETMLRALKNEPQIAICLNILPQLGADARMIPEEIRLSIGAFLPQNDPEPIPDQPPILPLANVFTLNRTTVLQNVGAYKSTGIPFLFPVTTVSIPTQLLTSSAAISILTEITVYKEINLLYNESGLTTAHLLNQFRTAIPPELACQYRVDKIPELDVAPSHI